MGHPDAGRPGAFAPPPGRLSRAAAHEPQWLRHADLLHIARVWGNAASYADTDPAAASAMRKCEDRLRTLHPYAMARYDRLRGDGMNPVAAMRETAPLFDRAPNVRVGDPAPLRPALKVSYDHEAQSSVEWLPGGPAPSGPSADGADMPDRGERRGRDISERLQARARAAGRPELSPDELAVILDASTNLPYDVIESLTRHPAEAGWVRAGADRSAARLAAESFPHTAADAVRAAAAERSSPATRAATRVPVPDTDKRPGRSL